MNASGYDFAVLQRVASEINVDGEGYKRAMERLEGLRGRVGYGLGLEGLEIDALEMALDR